MKLGAPFNPWRVFDGVYVPFAILRCAELSGGSKLAYGRLLRYAGEDGRCYPSLANLGVELGVSRDSAQRYVRELVVAGLIRTEARRSKCGDPDTHDVTFLWHLLFEDEGVGAEMPLPGRGENAPRVGAEMPRGVGAEMPPEVNKRKRSIEVKRARAANFPKTGNAILAFFPRTRNPIGFIADLVDACNEVKPDATDEEIAEGVRANYRKTQKGPGLFRHTIPEWLKASGKAAGDFFDNLPSAAGML